MRHDSFIHETWLNHPWGRLRIRATNIRYRVAKTHRIPYLDMNLCESCLMYERVMSHVWMRHVFCMNESCLLYEGSYRVAKSHKDPLSCRSFSTKEPLNIGHFCGKWHIKIRDPMSLRHPVSDVRRTDFQSASGMIKSRLVYEWVMSHIWMRHVSLWMRHVSLWMSHVSNMNESCHTCVAP